jgi:hypothetical protein
VGCERRRRCNPSEVWVAQPASPSSWPSRMSGRRLRRWSRCPRPLSAMRTSVQLVGRTPGVQVSGVQVSGVHATGVQTTGVIQVCGQPGVRCPRPLQPRCPYHAGSRASVRRDRPRLWLAQGSTPHLGRRLAGAQAAAPRWPPGRPRELVQRQVPVGWLGSREGQVLTRRPRRVHPGQVAGVMVDHGAGPGGGDHAPWSLSWCWSRRPAAEGLSGSAGSRRRPQRGRSLSGALSARR